MSGFGKFFPSMNQAVTPKPGDVVAAPKPAAPSLWWIDKAREEIGVKEIHGSKDNPRILEYHAYTTLKATDDETPWCSSFMCFVFGGGTRSAAARSWATWGQHLDGFKPGCIVVYKRTGGHHVHIGLSKSGDLIKGLGGNQSDSVCEASYKAGNVIAYRWPAGVPIPA